MMNKFFITLVLTSVWISAGAGSETDAKVITFPAPAGLEAAPDFLVTVNGESQFVYDTPLAAFTTFAFEGKADVQITAVPNVVLDERHQYSTWGRTIKAKPFDGVIRTVDIRPGRLGIEPSIEGTTLSFRIDRPCRLSVEINGNLSRPLFLFADNPVSEPVVPDAPNVRYFEGGKVHDVGEIKLHDNETVYLAGGAVVRGWITGENVSNARVLGHGVLDARISGNVRGIAVIGLEGCRNVVVDGPVLINQHWWTVVPRRSEKLSFRNLKLICWDNNSDGIDLCACRDVLIDGCFLRNNDDCIPIKAKVRHDEDPREDTVSRDDQDVVGVTVRNSVFWNARGGNALEIGFELCTATIRDILWQDCDVIHVEDGAVFSIHNADWANVENVRFENIWVEGAEDELIDLAIGLSIYSRDCPWEYFRLNPDRKSVPEEFRAQISRNNIGQWLRLPDKEMQERADNRGRIRDIHFRNIHVMGLGDELPYSTIAGYDAEHPVENVTIENLTFQGRVIRTPEEGRFRIEHARGVKFIADRPN